MSIDVIELQGLREHHESLLDDPEYVQDCPTGAAHSRLILALLDERDAGADKALRDRLEPVISNIEFFCSSMNEMPTRNRMASWAKELREVLFASPAQEPAQTAPCGHCGEAGVLCFDSGQECPACEGAGRVPSDHPQAWHGSMAHPPDWWRAMIEEARADVEALERLHGPDGEIAMEFTLSAIDWRRLIPELGPSSVDMSDGKHGRPAAEKPSHDR